MAVVRDYLITQFAFYGMNVFVNQLKSLTDTLSESFLEEKIKKAGISLESFKMRSAIIKGDFGEIQKRASNINKELNNLKQPLSSINQLVSVLPANLYPRTAQQSINKIQRDTVLLDQAINRAITALSQGDYAKAVRQIDIVNKKIIQIQKSMTNVSKYSTESILGQNLAQMVHTTFSSFFKSTSEFANKMGSIGLTPLDKATKAVIARINTLSNLVKNYAIPAFIGLGVAGLAAFFMISRAIYNVTENLRDAYRASVDLGISLKGSLALVRGLKMFGFDVSVISQATQKLSDSITKSNLAGRLMLGWLNLSPMQLQNMDTLKALDVVLTKIMQLPSVSLRKTIGKELLGERFPELLMMKEAGYIDTLRQMNLRYTDEYIGKVIEISKAWAIVKMNVQDIGVSLATAILPVLKQIAKITSYLVENSTILFTLFSILGVILTAAKKPLLGLPMLFLGLLGLYNNFNRSTNDNLNTIADELRTQTRIMDLQYRTLNTIRLQLNQFIATTARQTPDLYQASIYRSLLTNTGGI